VSGGTNSIATQLQDFSVTTPTFTTIPRTDSNQVQEQDKDQLLELATISLDQLLELQVLEVLLTQPQDVPLPLQDSELAQLAQAHLIQQAHQATSHQDQLADLASHLKLVDPLVTHQDHPKAHTQALKDHTQALVPPLLHQTCHHHPTNHLKASHHKLTHLTQLPAHHKLQTATTCHHAEDKSA
jgi:hypothetical protein